MRRPFIACGPCRVVEHFYVRALQNNLVLQPKLHEKRFVLAHFEFVIPRVRSQLLCPRHEEVINDIDTPARPLKRRG